MNCNNYYYQNYGSYVVPPVAATLSIVPAYYYLVKKSALQASKPMELSYAECFKMGMKAAPTVGGLVGYQMVLNERIERSLNLQKDSSFTSKLAVAAVVASLSTPLIALVNGQALGQKGLLPLKNLSKMQAVAITAQETAFVLGLSAAENVSAEMHLRGWTHPAVDYGSAYLAGFMGSMVGHPANAWLTLMQAGVREMHPSMLSRGTLTKAHGIGLFAMTYYGVKMQLMPA